MRVGSGSRGREPLEDQISSDISNIIQVPKPDLVTRGIVVDLIKVTSRLVARNRQTQRVGQGERSPRKQRCR